MSTWNSPPQIPAFKAPPFGATTETVQKAMVEYLKNLANVVSQLKNDLEFMLNGNLDVKNIRAKGIEADRLNVDELSAITANMGKLTSGQIYGAYISTAEGAYPRSEMSNTARQFGSYSTASRYVKIDSNPNAFGTPMANFGFDGAETWLMQVGSTFFIYSPSGVVNIGPLRTVFNGAVRLGGSQDLRFASVPGAADPDGAVISVNVLIAYLSAMGILP